MAGETDGDDEEELSGNDDDDDGEKKPKAAKIGRSKTYKIIQAGSVPMQPAEHPMFEQRASASRSTGPGFEDLIVATLKSLAAPPAPPAPPALPAPPSTPAPPAVVDERGKKIEDLKKRQVLCLDSAKGLTEVIEMADDPELEEGLKEQKNDFLKSYKEASAELWKLQNESA
jgi:hypothetical protein